MVRTGLRGWRSRGAAAALAALFCVSCQSGLTGQQPPASFVGSRPAPLVGVDMIYQDAPHILIRSFVSGVQGDRLATTLKSDLGLTAIRLNSFGFYSFLGAERSAEIRRETQQGNIFPWFPIAEVVRFVADHDIRIVAGLNPEDGPQAAVQFVEHFRQGGALDKIVAIELGNEPHLSRRPWLPEEYAVASSSIIRALEPYGLQFAVSLTVGSEAKTPTGISDDDYTRRELAAFDRELSLASRDDIYGVIHLYARGVNPGSIDRLNSLVRPVAPRMRYLITEFNIRSTLRDNAQLTVAYGLEFIEKTSRLVAHPDVAGLFVHGVPYHSVVYFSDASGIQTVSGFGDARLTGDALSHGWHLTPAGRMYGLFAREVWRGELLGFVDEGPVQIWTARMPDGELRLGVLNATAARLDRTVTLGDTNIPVALAPRSAIVLSAAGEIGRVELPEGP